MKRSRTAAAPPTMRWQHLAEISLPVGHPRERETHYCLLHWRRLTREELLEEIEADLGPDAIMRSMTINDAWIAQFDPTPRR